MFATWGWHKDPSNRLHTIALFSHVADANRVALSPFNGAGEHTPAQSHLDYILDAANRESIAPNGLAINVDFKIRFANDAIGKYGLGTNQGYVF